MKNTINWLTKSVYRKKCPRLKKTEHSLFSENPFWGLGSIRTGFKANSLHTSPAIFLKNILPALIDDTDWFIIMGGSMRTNDDDIPSRNNTT
jgi:hypothetical protein